MNSKDEEAVDDAAAEEANKQDADVSKGRRSIAAKLAYASPMVMGLLFANRANGGTLPSGGPPAPP